MSLISRIRTRASRFGKDRAGVSAVEFALILPIMMLLYAGTYEISEVLAVERKQTRVASTVADLVAQRTAMDSTEMNNIFNAAAAIMHPYDSSGAKILLLVLDIKADGQTVAWSQAKNDTAYTKGVATPIPVPSEIAVVGTQMVVARVQYEYSSPFSTLMKTVTGSEKYSLEDTYMMRPRVGTKITWQ